MDRFPPPHPIYPPVIHYGPAPIPLRKEPHIPLTPKTGMRRDEIERRIAEAGVTAEERAGWNAKYQKPSTGIPKTDLASGVQASLGKADTALQEHQSLSGYVQKSVIFDNPDTTPKVKSSLLPSYVDDVLEFASLSAFPSTGETGKIYVAKDTNKTYRWTGTQYVQVGGDEQAQADWAQTNSSSPDFIKNKPTIPAAQVQANWNEADTSSKAFIQNKPTIPTVPTNVSAFTNDAGYLTQHQSLSSYRTATAQDAIDGAQDTAISAKYSKPATGIPASDLAAGVIPSVPSASDATPQMDGTGAAGTATTYARGDHRHPSDTAKVSKSGDTMTGGLVVSAAGFEEIIGPIGMGVAAGSDSVSVLADRIVRAKNGASAGIYVPKPDVNLCTLAMQEGIAPAFSTSSTYAVGDYVTHEGLLYRCTTAVSTAGAWNAANWTAVAVTEEMGADTPLPFDAECEYVTVPDGTCINTEITSRGSILQWEATIRMPSTFDTTGNFRFGSWTGNASESMMVWMSSGPRRLDMILSGDRYISDWSAITGQFGKIGYDGRYVFCGDSTVVGPTQASGGGASGSNLPFTLFGLNGEPQSGNIGGDISSARFSFCNSPVRDLVPVRVGQVGYLYDKVSGRLFGSAVGSIPLVPGPDKATPTITKPDRLVEINERNNYLAYASTTTLAPETAVYRSALNADGTFPTITDTGIPAAAAYYQFELELTVPSTVPGTIYGPTMGGAAFDSTASYAVGSYVVYDNVEYVCVTAHTGAWDASHFKQAWVFLDGHGLPDPADLSGGETIYISVRLDCTARTFLASVWRVA